MVMEKTHKNAAAKSVAGKIWLLHNQEAALIKTSFDEKIYSPVVVHSCGLCLVTTMS